MESLRDASVSLNRVAGAEHDLYGTSESVLQAFRKSLALMQVIAHKYGMTQPRRLSIDRAKAMVAQFDPRQ